MNQNSQLEDRKKEDKKTKKEKRILIKKKLEEEKKKLELKKNQDKVLEEALQIEEIMLEETESGTTITESVTETVTETVLVNGTDDKKQKDNKSRKNRKKPILVSAAVFVVAAAFAAVVFLRIRNQAAVIDAENAAIEAMVHMEAVELAEYSQTQHKRNLMKDQLKKEAGKDAARALTDAAGYMIHGMRNRPPEIKLTEENTADFATIESCVINSETGKIDITMSAPGLAVSDDGYYYLFEEKTYETELSSEEYIVEDQKDVNLTFSVNLNYNTVGSRLFSKFVVAVRKDGEFVAISKPKYITNPEAIAR